MKPFKWLHWLYFFLIAHMYHQREREREREREKFSASTGCCRGELNFVDGDGGELTTQQTCDLLFVSV